MEPSSLVRHISGELKSWHTEWSKKNGANKNLISSLEENLASLEESMVGSRILLFNHKIILFFLSVISIRKT